MKIGIIDIIHHKEYSKIISPLMANIMPQVIATWLEQLGHNIWYTIHTGYEKLPNNLNDDIDIIFISSYTMSAYLAYSISNYYRSKGIITILGGPHARSYPEDSKNYFDYVIGLTSKKQIEDLVQDININKYGVYLTEKEQPDYLCRIEDRWKFIKQNFKRFIPITVPMISSTGCPNTCDFCIDSVIKYKSFIESDLIRDLIYLQNKNHKINIMWHDPNFGVKLNSFLNIIETFKGFNNLTHTVELGISKLNEETVKRLYKNNFIAIGPGIESWSAYNNKASNKSFTSGLDKVNYIAEQLNMVNKYIPVIQANIIFGLDQDNNKEHFDLTKEFIKRTPGIYTNLQTLTLFGNSTPLIKRYEKENRVIKNFPYNLMDGFSASNAILNMDPVTFYRYYSNLTKFSKSLNMKYNKFINVKGILAKTFSILREFSKDRGSYKYYKNLYESINNNHILWEFFNGEINVIPSLYTEQIKKELGNMVEYLPQKVLNNFQIT